MKSVFLFGLLSTVYACSHPIEIVGEGDVLSATGTRTCFLEDFQAKKENCTRNIVHGEYTETYYAEPRDGWQFDQWLNYCTDAVNNECAFNIPSDAVQKNWGATLPPLVAVFKRIPLTIAEPASEPSPVPELPDTQSAPVAIYSYYLDRDGRLINPLPLENARLQRRTTHFGVTGDYQRISFRCCEVADDDAVHAPKVDVPAPTKILTVDLAALPNNHRQRLELHANLVYQDGTIASNSSVWFLEPKENEPLMSRSEVSGLIDNSNALHVPVDSRYTAKSKYYLPDAEQTQMLHLALVETSVTDSPGSGSYTTLLGMSGNDWVSGEVDGGSAILNPVASSTTVLAGGQTQLVLQGPNVVEDAVITAWRTQNSAWLDGRNQNHGGDTGASSGLGLDPRDAYELYGDARDAQQKMLLRFDLSDIPAGATIDSAVLGVYNSYSDGYDMPIYRVKTDWYEGEGNYWDLYPTSAAGVTYLYPDKSNTAITWGAEGLLAGTDYDSTAAGTIHFGGSAPAMRSSTELAALVQGWVDGDYANFGILVAMTPSGNSLYGIANWIPTSENAVVANRPKLTVTYSDASPPDPSVPGVAIDPSPSDNGTGMSVTVDLEWTAGSDATSHDVYFGTSPPGVFQGNQTGTTFDPGPLEPNTTYYWRIDEVNDAGTTTGTVWSFTTGLEAGVDKSGWILGSEVWSGVINIVGDTTISGANTVVTVLPGTRIIYKGDYILKSADRSRLLMNATPESPIVVDAQATSGKLQIRGGQGEIRFCRLLNISVSATYPLLEPPLLTFEDNINLGIFYSGQQQSIIKRNYFGIYGDFVPGTLPSPFTGSAAGSEVTDNVFNGGAWVAQAPQSTVRGNVFVSEYVPEGAIQNDYSHEHVLGMGTNCVFERNIFVGKSYGAMMAIGSNYGSYCLVRNNTIDMRGEGVGIYFHLTASPVVGMEVRNNLFLRATTGINDEQKQTNSIAYTDYNLFSEVDDRYSRVLMSDKEEGDDGYGLHDVEVGSPEKVIVNPTAGYPFPYSQAEIIAGNVKPTDMLQFYRRAYALTSNSPAINAGSPVDASDPEVTDGQCDIGALEYQVPETTMLNQ